ncbi:GPI inositol deacylase [Entomortierella lignicola]|nr:GPI inositol deacylase [Entomortierella lignicola]
MSEKHILDHNESHSKNTLGSTTPSSPQRRCLVHSSFYHHQDPKGCLMTFMQPTYYKILGFDEYYTELAGKYGLLLYRDEGDEHPVLHTSQLTDIGDHDRAIAKSAKYLVDKRATKYTKFVFLKYAFIFSVDFNEEFSAFHGHLLLDQSKYVNEAIAYILSLYSDSDPALPRPTSVLIIGHSMGGIVARTLFIMDNFVAGSVNTILTLATPHMVPPLALDYTITDIYDKIEEFWIRGYESPQAALANVSLVSIMGGNQDITVNSDAGNIHYIVPQSHGFSVFTSSIPHAWVGSDHLSILWCNQVVKQIGIALVEMIDASTSDQVKPLTERLRVLRNHLLSEDPLFSSPGSRDIIIVNLSSVSHSFEKGEVWASPTRKPVPTNQQTSAPHYHILTIPKRKDLDTLTLLTNLKLGSHEGFNLLLCKDGTNEKTLACESDSLPSAIIPGSTRESSMPLFTQEYFTGQEFRFVSIPLRDLENFQYVVLSSKRDVYVDSNFVIAEFKNDADTTETIHTSAIGLLRNGLMRSKFPVKPSLVSTIRLPNVDNSLLAYNIKVNGGSCAGVVSRARFAPMMKQSNWATNEDRFYVNIANKENGIDINFHGDLPYYNKVLLRTNNGIELQFWRDPTCKEPLSLTLTVDNYGSLGKIVIRYRTIIVVFTFMVVILTLRAQIKDWDKNGSFKPFGVVLSDLIKTTYWKFSLLLVFVSFIQSLKPQNATLLSAKTLEDVVFKNGTWVLSDWFDNALLGRNETFFWLLSPIFLQMAVGVVAFVWFILSTVVRAVSIIIRLMTKNKPLQHSNGAGRSAMIGVILVLIARAIPYQLAFAMTVIALLIISAQRLAFAQGTMNGTHSLEAWNSFHFAMSILIMFFFLLPFAVPTLMLEDGFTPLHQITVWNMLVRLLSLLKGLQVVLRYQEYLGEDF